MPMWIYAAVWLLCAWQMRLIEPRAAVFMVFIGGWMLGWESLRLVQRVKQGE